jgi:DNA-binding transcriptional MerR regulator
MRIGELAERAGTSTRSLRYYEQQGLLAARRNPNGHRDYDESDLRLVREIRGLLTIGFALEETRPFVECLRSGHSSGDSCPASVAVYRRKLAEVEEYLDRLGEVRDHLRSQLARVTNDLDNSEESPCTVQQPCPSPHPRTGPTFIGVPARS